MLSKWSLYWDITSYFYYYFCFVLIKFLSQNWIYLDIDFFITQKHFWTWSHFFVLHLSYVNLLHKKKKDLVIKLVLPEISAFNQTNFSILYFSIHRYAIVAQGHKRMTINATMWETQISEWKRECLNARFPGSPCLPCYVRDTTWRFRNKIFFKIEMYKFIL